MSDWQNRNFNLLVECIVNEFIEIHKRMLNSREEIYGVALILDSDALTVYMSVSTNESLEKDHENIKWVPYEWSIGNDENDVSMGLNFFIEKHIEYYDQNIVPKFSSGNYDYTYDFNENIEMFILGMKCAKKELKSLYGNNIEQIVFLICIPGDDELLIRSAQLINLESENLQSFLKDIT